jgi:hypothetical protein
MKVRYIGESDPLALLNGKVYDVIAIEEGWYRIIDEAGTYEDDEIPGYLYSPKAFEIVSGSEEEFTQKQENGIDDEQT